MRFAVVDAKPASGSVVPSPNILSQTRSLTRGRRPIRKMKKPAGFRSAGCATPCDDATMPVICPTCQTQNIEKQNSVIDTTRAFGVGTAAQVMTGQHHQRYPPGQLGHERSFRHAAWFTLHS